MDFDWTLFSPQEISAEEVAESFEDPFSLRLLPDSPRFSLQARFFCLGCTTTGKPIFSLYSSTGKIIRVIMSRPMTEEEVFFYNRKAREEL